MTKNQEKTAWYKRWPDDVWSCSNCGEDLEYLFPKETQCPECGIKLRDPRCEAAKKYNKFTPD